MVRLPVVNQPAHHPGALLDHLARRMRLRAEAVLAPLGLRPRHLVALTVLRDRGGSTQQALAATLEMDGTNIVGLLNELEAEKLIERRRSPEDRRRHLVELTDVGADRLATAECALSAVRTRCSARGVATTSVGTHRTLAATSGGIRGKRAEHVPLTAAHLVQALPHIIAIEQRRIGQAPPHLVQQIPVLPGGPQLADQVTDGMHAADVQQQPG
jgi:DNA-binding MarR family transcriptional regulator